MVIVSRYSAEESSGVRAISLLSAPIALVLLGCGASVTRIPVPGNRNGYRIDCSTATASACEFEAKHQCPNGYQVIASEPDILTIACRFPASTDSSDKEAPSDAAGETADAVQSSVTPPRAPQPLGMVYGFSFGGGFIETSESREPRAAAEGTGWGFAASALVARELLPGFALGGLVGFQQLNALRMDIWETDNTVSLGFIGPDLETLFCSTNCLRLGGAVGAAIVSAPALSDVERSIAMYERRVGAAIPADANSISAGLGYDVHLAYDLQFAPRWYAGLGARVLGRLSNDRSIVGYSIFVDVLNR